MLHQLVVLGSGGALPDLKRNTSSYLLLLEKEYILFDCGEAAQHNLIKYGYNKNKINHICITHLHGDHVYGLIGLLSSMSMSGRQYPLIIYGPIGIESFILHQFSFTEFVSPFLINFVELSNNEKCVIFDCKSYSISAFPLKHRIPTFGYLYQSKQMDLNIKKEAIEKYTLTVEDILCIKKGESIFRNSKLIPNEELVFVKSQPKSFAFCSDTIFDEEIVPIISNVDLLFHEATFLEIDISHAIKKMHSTANQAGEIAKKGNVKMLLIGHISARYDDFDAVLFEATIRFKNTILATDGLIVDF
jgi:ribonuclease Z